MAFVDLNRNRDTADSSEHDPTEGHIDHEAFHFRSDAYPGSTLPANGVVHALPASI